MSKNAENSTTPKSIAEHMAAEELEPQGPVEPGFTSAKYKKELASVNTGIPLVDELNGLLNILATSVGFRQAHEAARIFKDINMQVALNMSTFATLEEAAQFADTTRNSPFGKGNEPVLATVAAMLRREAAVKNR